ncbi:MAG: DNA-processing protein DprA [Peptococcaceae bacterium]|nr:DNA-processing protein DprA [Peptococcaceae bacterium]
MHIGTDYAEKIARAAVVSVPGVAAVTLRQLLADCGSALRAWQVQPAEVSADGAKKYAVFFQNRGKVDLAQLEETLNRLDIKLTTPGERAYPALLSTLSDAPPVLFYRGVLDGSKEAVAVVGARRATAYGKSAAAYFGRELAARGLAVVSGLARGIDGAAQEGALSAGVTWAYLGGGLDRIYPAEHKKLAQMVMERGALISEYPPGTATLPNLFPARNRLISGSARGVVVVEAAEKSGSLITVDFALEQGREVFAVPGPIFSSLSKGCHHLLRMGAHVAETADDVLQALPAAMDKADILHPVDQWTIDDGEMDNGISKLISDNGEWGQARDTNLAPDGDIQDVQDKNTTAGPREEYQDLLDFLSDIPIQIDRLAVQSNRQPHELAMGLLHLELAGYIQRLPGQHYILDRRRQVHVSTNRSAGQDIVT